MLTQAEGPYGFSEAAVQLLRWHVTSLSQGLQHLPCIGVFEGEVLTDQMHERRMQLLSVDLTRLILKNKLSMHCSLRVHNISSTVIDLTGCKK